VLHTINTCAARSIGLLFRLLKLRWKMLPTGQKAWSCQTERKFFMRSKIFLLPANIALGLGLAFPAQAQDAKTLLHEALKKDAEFISRAMGETVENTLRQLQLENDIAEQQVSIKLREEFQERLTGISIDHKQGSRLIVLLKGNEKVPERGRSLV